MEILRSALERLDEGASGGPDDPAVLNFKRCILRSLAQFEISRNSLQAPDVVVPSRSSEFSASSAPHLAERQPAVTDATVSASDASTESAAAPAAPDSVTVLVARRSRKSGGDSGGHSSAA